MEYNKILKAKATVSMPYTDYEKLLKEIELMRKALDDKSIMVASYYGYEYHIVNYDEIIKRLTEDLNKKQ